MCLEDFIELTSYKDKNNILTTLEMELIAIREQGFVLKHCVANTTIGKGLIAVIRIMTVWS